jgi:two-component system, NarL family, nitrate/nitrite response regulator NarL
MPETAQQTIAVFVLDDHALFRESLVRLLGAERDFEVVGHTGSIDEALAALRQKHVDLILLDFDLGEGDGNQFLRLAKRQGFSGKVLVVTAGVEEPDAVQLIHWGISGIFMKNNSAAMLAQGIRDVMAGKVWFDQEFLQAIVAGSPRPASEPQTMRLTQRERHVLLAVFEGMANKEIAERLGVSESSVKATLQQLFSKTGVRTRSQLVRIALEQYKNEL